VTLLASRLKSGKKEKAILNKIAAYASIDYFQHKNNSK
jgi:hypothetical protein